MARKFQVETQDQSIIVDFIDGPLIIRSETWSTRNAPLSVDYAHKKWGAQMNSRYYNVITEQFEFVVDRTAQQDILDEIMVLEDLFARARRWHENEFQRYAVWLRWNTEDEADRRSLIYHASLQFISSEGISPFMRSNVLRGRVNLVHHPFYEEAGYGLNTGTTTIHGGKWTPGFNGGTYLGTAPARIQNMQIESRATSGDDYERIWVGFRDPATGSDVNFTAAWQLSDGTIGTDCVTQVEAGRGTKVVCSFTTVTTMALRCSTSVADALGADSVWAWIGRWLGLLEVKTDSGTSVLVQARVSTAYGNSIAMPMEQVLIDTGGVWRLIEIGEFKIPPTGYRDPLIDSNLMSGTTIEIWIERLGGSGNVEFSDLVMIPAEHLLAVDGADLSTATMSVRIICTPDDNRIGAQVSTVAGGNVQFATRDFYFPVSGDAVVVVACDSPDGHDRSDDVYLRMETVKRYFFYRE